MESSTGQKADFKYISIKTLFLILMACAKRWEQIYHLNSEEIDFADHYKEVSIGVLPEYV